MLKYQNDTNISIAKTGTFQIDRNPSIICERDFSPVPIVLPTQINPDFFTISQSSDNTVISTKIIVLTIFLVCIGFGLLVSGFVIYVITNNSNRGIVFWVFGCLLLIPGLYYLWSLFLVWRTKNSNNKINTVKEENQELN